MSLIEGNALTSVVKIDGEVLHPTKSQLVLNHSPDGFSWGYEGSGPSQLALAILLEYTDNETALFLHHDFKNHFVANWPYNKSFSEEVGVEDWIADRKDDHLY